MNLYALSSFQTVMLNIRLFIFSGDLWPTISKMKEIDEKLDTVVCSALIIVAKGDYRRMWA